MSAFWQHQLVELLLGVAVAIQLNVVFGLAGVWIFALALQIGVGQLSYAVLVHSGAPPVLAMIATLSLGAAMGGLMGAIHRVLRGDSFLILTIGLTEAVREFVYNGPRLLGGPSGLFDVRPVVPAAWLAPTLQALLLALVVALGSWSWQSWVCRAPSRWLLRAEDQDPVLYRQLGLHHESQVAVLVVAGIVAAACGVVGAVLSGYASLGASGLMTDVLFYAMVILGGVRWRPGPVVGALVVVGVPALLMISSVADPTLVQHRVKPLLFGATLVLFAMFAPGGLRQLLERTPPSGDRGDHGPRSAAGAS